MILGCDAAGLDEDGNEVVVHAVISDPSLAAATRPSTRSGRCCRERYQGTFADRVAVPRRNVVPKPACLSFEEAACLPTAWLTAYRMLFTQGGLKPGDTRAGAGRRRRRRDRADRAGPRRRPQGATPPAATRPSAQRALELGAHEVFETGAAAARAGRRRDGDRRPGDLVALDPVAAAGRHAS